MLLKERLFFIVNDCGVYSFQTDCVEEYFPPKAAPLILERLSLSKARGEDSLPPPPQSTQQKDQLSSKLVLIIS